MNDQIEKIKKVINLAHQLLVSGALRPFQLSRMSTAVMAKSDKTPLSLRASRLLNLTLALIILVIPVSGYADGYLSDFVIASEVDDYTFAPTKNQNHFNTQVPEIWATTFINQASEGTLIEVDWLQLRNGQFQKILGSRIEAEGSRYYAANIQPTDGEQLPVGKFRVIYKLNGVTQGSSDFEITAAEENITQDTSTTVSTATKDKAATIESKSNEQIAVCTPPQETAEELASLVGSNPDALKYFNFQRYTDPQGRFSLVVPGAWFPADSGDQNQALFLSPNMENDPLLWFVIHAYKAHLTPKFTAADTVNQLRDMLLKEGAAHGASEVPTENSATQEVAKDIALGSLTLHYTTTSGKEIGQVHTLVVAGEHAFNIQISTEDAVAEEAGMAFEIANSSFWTETICKASQQ